MLIAAISIGLFVIAILMVRIRLRMLSADYFVINHAVKTQSTFKIILQNILGWILILLGIPMLVTPGPGWPIIFVGVTFVDFPGKAVLERYLIKWQPIFKSLNALRCQAWSFKRKKDLKPFMYPNLNSA